MDSLSKTPLSAPDAQRIVLQQFGSARKISSFEELKEGFFNAAYRFELQDGLEFVLKIAPPPQVRILSYEQNIMRAEVETMRLVSSRTNLPIPQILFHDESRSLLPSPYFAMEFVPGVPLHKFREALSKDEQSAIDQTIGRYLRQMNAISADQFGCFARPMEKTISWAQAFDSLLQDVLQDGLDAGVELPLAYPEISAITRRCASVLDEVTTPSLVHWDLWDGNIFIDPHTRQISGIIDFERALWADPLMEPNFGAFGLNPDFLLGYGCPVPFTTSQQTRRTLYNVYLFLIMVIECTYRQYPNHDQENWARMRLGEECKKLD